MPALPGRENDYFTSRQEKFAEQTIGSGVKMPPHNQISVEEYSINNIIFVVNH